MLKKILALLFLVSMVFLSGCETTKGLAKAASLTAQGLAQDTKTLWSKIKNLDSWFKENLW